MKKSLLSFFVFCGSVVAFAQPSVGTLSVTPRVGMTLSEPSGDDVTVDFICISKEAIPPVGNLERVGISSFKPKRKAGFTAGFDFQYQSFRNLALVLGVNFAQLRSTLDLEEPHLARDLELKDVTNISNYIQMPILVKAYLYKGLSIQAGLQFDWHLKSKVDLDYDINGIRIGDDKLKIVTINNSQYYVGMGEAHMEDVSKFEFALPMGISYEYRNLVASLTYSIALSRSAQARKIDFLKSLEYKKTIYEKNGLEYKNSTFMLTLGYRINLLGK